ncbi:hypothetical protein DSO57_1008407 [Entomophthora muscae]|uniref:Uncharacterized protein n=1 Tax=Entomophthora muscae TaxID=34485 RepID=A0ACC2TUJ8_9FUNG|nr:hypothetical protein DSO57_1008407 [Entomophthora muscae]
MADITPEDHKAFMHMPHFSWVHFLNQLLPTGSHQLWPQDCDTTVAGSEHGTITHAEEEECGVPVHQSPKCVLDCSQGPAGRGCHSLGLKWDFIQSHKEDPLRNLLVYGPGGQGNNMDLPILGVLQQYLGLLVLGLRLLHLSLGLCCVLPQRAGFKTTLEFEF